MTNYGTLYDYKSGEPLRNATKDEMAASIEAAKHDSGRGTIRAFDGMWRTCYVVGEDE